MLLYVTVCYCMCISIDINECQTNNGGCDHNCTNQVGSYLCHCNNGFTLNENQHGCTGQ